MFLKLLFTPLFRALLAFLIIITLFAPLQLAIFATQLDDVSITPFVEKVEFVGDGKYQALFNYENTNKRTIVVAQGVDNSITGASASVTTQFLPGKQRGFNVILICQQSVTWSLKSSNATEAKKATATAPLCGSVENPDTTKNTPQSTCENPVGWTEDITARTENIKEYFVPKNNTVPAGSTPTKNPENFNTMVCSFMDKVNYKDSKTGEFKTVSNTIKETGSSSITQDSNSAFSSQNSNKEKNDGYAYESGNNDFKAYFNKDPNLGWKFVSTGLTMSVSKVTVGTNSSQKLIANKAIIKDNTVTYSDILNGVDLQYVVSSTGVNKFFVLKNELALTNDLSQIQLSLDSNKKVLRPQTNAITAKIEAENQFEIKQPVTLDNSSSQQKAENYTVSADGKTYTIFPDQAYLKQPERKFPILIDPEVRAVGQPYKDLFVRSVQPYNIPGKDNYWFLAVGGNSWDTSTNNYLGKTRTYMQFPKPADLTDPAMVVWANMGVKQYNTYRSGFNANVYRFAGNLDENYNSWNTQNPIFGRPGSNASYGSLPLGNVNTNGAGNTRDAWTTDIRDLVADHTNTDMIRIALTDPDENADRSAIFCSKDPRDAYHPCNSSSKGPFLQMYLNRRPTAPTAISPDSAEFIGNCDKSVIPNTGNCSPTMQVPFQIGNINDGDGNCSLAYTKIDAYAPLRRPDWSEIMPPTAGCGNQTYPLDSQNGRYYYRATNRDSFGLESPASNIATYNVDTQPAVAFSQFKTPEFAAGNQVQFTLPQYGDNLTDKYGIAFAGYEKKPMRILWNDSNNALTAGSNGNLTSTVFTNNTRQQWVFDGYAVQLGDGGRTLCLASNGSSAGSTVGVSVCNGSSTMQWIFSDQNQLQLKDTSLCIGLDNGDASSGQYTLQMCKTKSEKQTFDIDVAQSREAYGLVLNGWTENVTVLDRLIFGVSQQWTIQDNGYIIGANSLCLTTEGGDVNNALGKTAFMRKCSDAATQKWEVSKSFTALGKGNLQTIKLRGTNLCLEVTAGIEGNGVTPILATCNQTMSQKWSLQPYPAYRIGLKQNPSFSLGQSCGTQWCNVSMLGNTQDINSQGWYVVGDEIKVQNGMCLELNNGDPGTGHVLINYCNGGINQKWSFESNGTIKNKWEGGRMCLDIWAGSISENANIGIFPCHDGITQQFTLTPFFQTISPTHQITYNVQVSNNPNFENNNSNWRADLGWQRANIAQYPNFSVEYPTSAPRLEDNQTYYYRVRSSDRSNGMNTTSAPQANISTWSETATITQDAQKPKVDVFSFSSWFFSPANNGKTTITLKTTEKNLQSIKLQIKDRNEGSLSKDTIVRTLTRCDNSNKTNVPCTYLALNKEPNSDQYIVQFSFDGKDDSGAVLTDGVYEITPIITDKAGNTNDAQSDVVRLNSSGVPINITQPQNNSWTNKPTVTIKGSLGIAQSDNSANSGLLLNNFTISKVPVAPTNVKTTSTTSISNLTYQDTLNEPTNGYNRNFNFSSTQNLDLGQNVFNLSTTDVNGNTFGTSSKPYQISIGYEQDAPQITQLLPETGKLNRSNFGINFNVQDPVLNNNPNLTSGLSIGTNPKNYTVSLLQSLDNGTTWTELPLFKQGENVSTGSPKIASSLVCTYTTTANNLVNCKSDITNLQPDGQYKLFVSVKDNAGNETCNALYTEVKDSCGKAAQIQNLESITTIKTQTVLEVNQPVTGSLYADTQREFSGKAEKGTRLTILNKELNRLITIKLDATKDNTLPAEFSWQPYGLVANEAQASPDRLLTSDTNPIRITCTEKRDHDNNPQTADIDICNYSIKLNLAYNVLQPGQTDPASLRKTNNIITEVSDSFGNIKTVNQSFDVNPFALTITSKPSNTYFTPNNDGNYDGITFSNSVNKYTDGSSYTEALQGWKAQIKNTNGNVVWEKTSLDALGISGLVTYNNYPTTITFNGKGNVGVSNGQNLPDGNYTYVFEVKTQNGLVYASSPQTITAKANVGQNEMPIIFSPTTGSTTTHGVITIQGQVPRADNGQLWLVDMCLAETAVVSNFSRDCASYTTFQAQPSGYFSSLVQVPTTSLTAKTYTIITRARLVNIVNGSQVTTTVTTPTLTGPQLIFDPSSDIFNSIDLVPTLENGLNTKAEIDAFISQIPINGKVLTINDLKRLSIVTKVKQNTEGVDITFSENNNGLANTNIAQINDLIETDKKWNPNSDITIKKNVQQIPKTSIKDLPAAFKKSCIDAAGCTWVYNYPYSGLSVGGVYELQLKGYKGQSISQNYESLQLNNQYLSAPTLLKVQKNNADVYRDNRTFYTNQNSINLIGAADPSVNGNTTFVTIMVKNSAGQVVQTITTDNQGGQLAADASGLFRRTVVLPDSEDNYSIDLKAVSSANANNSRSSVAPFTISLDKTAPKITVVRTTAQNLVSSNGQTAVVSNNEAVNPWINSGDLVTFNVVPNEAVQDLKVISEAGFECTALAYSAINPNQSTKICGTVDLNNVLPNTSTYRASLVINAPGDTGEGVYHSGVYMMDRAGNSVLYSNDPLVISADNTERNKSIIGNLQTSSVVNATNAQKVYINPLDQSSWGGNGNTNLDTMPANYPYNYGISRGRSLDFRLFVDNTLPNKVDSFDFNCDSTKAESKTNACYPKRSASYNTPNYEQTLKAGIRADGFAPEASRIHSDSKYFAHYPTIFGRTAADTIKTPANSSNNADDYLTPMLVIKGDSLTLKAPIEKNQRVVLKAKITDRTAMVGGQPVVQEYNSYPLSSQSVCNPTANPASSLLSTDKTTTRGVRNYGNGSTAPLITKFKQSCTVNLTYNFRRGNSSFLATATDNPNTGSQVNGTLDPRFIYDFSFYPVDLAGNVPLALTSPNFGVVQNGSMVGPALIGGQLTPISNPSYMSNTLTVYHDNQTPTPAAITNITRQDPSNQDDVTLTDFSSADNAAITNAPLATVQTNGEIYADLEQMLDYQGNSVTNNTTTSKSAISQVLSNPAISIRNDANAVITTDKSKVLTLDPSGNNKTNITFGNSTRDELLPQNTDTNKTNDCITVSNAPIKNRRVSTCANGDGIYTIKERVIDTAGNRSGWTTKQVERDTVNPAMANVTIGKSGMRGNEYLGININGEANTKANITISYPDGKSKFLMYNLNTNGEYINNQLSIMECGKITYSVTVRLIDRAGNESGTTALQSVTSGECVSCSTSGTGLFSHPIHSVYAPVTGEFIQYGVNNTTAHGGMDFGVGFGTPVYAAASGTVIEAVYSNTDNYGKPDPYNTKYGGFGNRVVVDHGGGLISIYGHLAPTAMMSVGQSVTSSTIIGYVGSTGSSSGPHLHFQVEKQNAPVIPLVKNLSYKYPIVNPRDYLGNIDGNATAAEKAVYCDSNATGGLSQDEKLPELTEEMKKDARYRFSEFIMSKLDGISEIENSKDNRQVFTRVNQLQQKNVVLSSDPNNPKSLYNFIEPMQTCDGIYYQNFGKLKEKSGGEAYDAALIYNSYATDNDQKVFIVKNSIWDRYSIEMNTMCTPIGLPSAGEDVIEQDSLIGDWLKRTVGWEQKFRYASYVDNKIMISNGKLVTEGSHYIVKDVANDYRYNGSIKGFYGFPKSDTYPSKVSNPDELKYCKQEFHDNKTIDLCNDVTTTLKVNTYDTSTETSLHVMFPDNSTEAKKIQYKYPDGANVWIVSHGMLNNYDSLKEVSEAIHKVKPNDIVLNVDWGGARKSSEPQGTDQWIRPTAEVLYKRLSAWGLTDPSKVNLAGHSMGTLMSAELARQYNIHNNNTEVNSMYLLDPPNNIPNFLKLSNKFDVDDRDDSENIDSIYDKYYGYAGHAKAKTMRAYTGKNYLGKDNTCGNSELNKTAKENIMIYTSSTDVDDSVPGCEIHAMTYKAFAKILFDQPVIINGSNALALDENGMNGYNHTIFYTQNDNMQASIVVSGRKDSEKIEFALIADGNSSNYLAYGANGDNEFRIFSVGSPGFDKNMAIKNFRDTSNNDTIRLFTNQYYSPDETTYTFTYQIQEKNGRKEITRRACENVSNACTSFETHTTVEGDGKNEINQAALDLALYGNDREKASSPIKLR